MHFIPWPDRTRHRFRLQYEQGVACNATSLATMQHIALTLPLIAQSDLIGFDLDVVRDAALDIWYVREESDSPHDAALAGEFSNCS